MRRGTVGISRAACSSLEDDGSTWREALRGLADQIVEAGSGRPAPLPRVSASQAAALWRISASKGCGPETGAAGLYNGVARTDDGGRTWRIVHRESNNRRRRCRGRGSKNVQ